jgi:hypothetical protein
MNNSMADKLPKAWLVAMKKNTPILYAWSTHLTSKKSIVEILDSYNNIIRWVK